MIVSRNMNLIIVLPKKPYSKTGWNNVTSGQEDYSAHITQKGLLLQNSIKKNEQKKSNKE